jgi:mono/diheme cytochrome c family protein
MKAGMKLAILAALAAAVAPSALAQATPAQTKTAYEENCGFCHDTGENGAPLIDKLKALEPAAIVEKMTTGSMAGFSGALSDPQKREIAVWLTGKGLPASGNLPEVKPAQ